MSQSILTPASRGAGSKVGGKTFWKQVLPEAEIQYTTQSGRRAKAVFDKEYLQSLVDAFNGPLKDTAFVLADDNNKHTMDPERVRATIADMKLASELPPGVENDGTGLYVKVKFPSAAEAKAVMTNPNLGVSARIREGIALHDGTTVPRGIIHVLGTLDPQVKGMSPWQQVDLSVEDDELIDLSTETYEKGNDVPKTPKKAVDIPIKDREINSFTEDEINGFTEDQLDEFLATFADVVSDDDDGSNTVVDDDSNADDDSDDDNSDADNRPLATAGADLSTKNKNAIDLANAQVADAHARANEALRRVADAEWKATRAEYAAAGVPPHLLDLAEPVLNRPDDMVIDLSNSDDDDINVSEIIKGFLDDAKGTVDLSNESGHSAQFVAGAGGDDPDKAALEMWEKQFSK